MEKIFNPENRVMRFLGFMCELMILNLLTMLCCLPVITAGASLTAMHSVLLSLVRGENGYVSTTFFRAFRENLRQATAVWMGMLLLIMGLLYVNHAADGIAAGRNVYVSIGVIAFAAAMLASWLLPLIAHFENTLVGEMRVAALLTVACLPKTVAMAAVTAGFFVLYMLSWVYLLPAIILLGITAPSAICAKIYDPVFRKLEENAAAQP